MQDPNFQFNSENLVLNHTRPLLYYTTFQQLTIHSQRDTWVWPNRFLGGNPWNGAKNQSIWNQSCWNPLGIFGWIFVWNPSISVNLCLESFHFGESLGLFVSVWKRKRNKYMGKLESFDEQKSSQEYNNTYIVSWKECKNTTFHLAWPSLTILWNKYTCSGASASQCERRLPSSGNYGNPGAWREVDSSTSEKSLEDTWSISCHIWELSISPWS